MTITESSSSAFRADTFTAPYRFSHRDDRRCENCGHILCGDVFFFDDMWLCEDCFQDIVDNMTLYELADAMNVDRAEI